MTYPYRSHFADLTKSASALSRPSGFATQVREARRRWDEHGTDGYERSELAQQIEDFSELRDSLRRVYVPARDGFVWLSVGVGSVGGLVGLIGLVTRLGTIAAWSIVAVALAVAMCSRMMVVIVDQWIQPLDELTGLINDMRKAALEMKTSAREMRESNKAGIERLQAEVAQAEALLATLESRGSGVRLEPEAQESSVDDEADSSALERRGRR